ALGGIYCHVDDEERGGGGGGHRGTRVGPPGRRKNGNHIGIPRRLVFRVHSGFAGQRVGWIRQPRQPWPWRDRRPGPPSNLAFFHEGCPSGTSRERLRHPP